MSTTNRKLTLVFERYFSTRLEEASAITPGQKKDLIAQLRRELNEDGRIPLPAGPVKASLRPAQFCQLSIIASAIALQGATKNASRPSAVRLGRSKPSCWASLIIFR